MRLQTRFLITAVSIIVAVVSILTAALLKEFHLSMHGLLDISQAALTSNLRNQMEKRSEAITQILSENLVNPVYNADMQSMFELLSATKKLKDVRYALIYDTDGKLLHDGTREIRDFGQPVAGADDWKNIGNPTRRMIQKAEDALDVTYPILIGDKSLGAVKVGLSLTAIHEDIKRTRDHIEALSNRAIQRTIRTVAVTTMIMIVFGAALSIAAAIRLIRPIRAMARYAARVGEGDYSVQMSSNFKGEIGALIRAFNRMGRNLLRHEQALLEANTRLEQRVAERTADLQQANENLAAEIAFRGKAESDARESDERLTLALKAAGLCTWSWTLAEGRTLWGGSSLILFGPGKHETPETWEDYLQRVHPEDRRQVRSAIDNVLEKGQDFDIQYRITWPDGSTHFIADQGRVYRDGTGKPMRITGVCRDVSNMKRLQEKLIRSERLAASGQLAASVAHEINSPLQAISVLLGTMGNDYRENGPLREHIAVLKKAFGNIRDTVKNLLDLNRPGTEIKQTCQINSIIEHTVALTGNLIKRNGIEISMALSQDIPQVQASAQQMNQVLLNLINNAIEVMADHPPAEEDADPTERQIKKILISTDRVDNFITITVADTGPGISETALSHIFDPFYSTKKQMGLGVGLATCQGIIEDHHGSIIAKNRPEGGAAFTITLPADQAA